MRSLDWQRPTRAAPPRASLRCPHATGCVNVRHRYQPGAGAVRVQAGADSSSGPATNVSVANSAAGWPFAHPMPQGTASAIRSGFGPHLKTRLGSARLSSPKRTRSPARSRPAGRRPGDRTRPSNPEGSCRRHADLTEASDGSFEPYKLRATDAIMAGRGSQRLRRLGPPAPIGMLLAGDRLHVGSGE
jgi:hypothetical protein